MVTAFSPRRLSLGLWKLRCQNCAWLPMVPNSCYRVANRPKGAYSGFFPSVIRLGCRRGGQKYRWIPTPRTQGIGSLSKSQVSRMATDLGVHVGGSCARSSKGAGPLTFVAADAQTMKARESGRMINTVLMMATGN
jgi:hypothetical protein